MNKVSIIVPVYGTQEYLPQCVESLMAQTYQNIEIILIDDGGTDGCPALCDHFAEVDPRVICLHKQNEGQSFARRDGFAVSTGDYIMFVDSDDWMELDTVQSCVEKAEETDADVILFGYKRIYENRIFNTALFPNTKVFTDGDVVNLQRRMVGLFEAELTSVETADRLTPMWGKLYKREVAAAGAWYSEREVGSSEDALFNLHAFSACKKCAYIDQYFYCYRKTNETATTRKYRAQLIEQWRILWGHFQSYISGNNLNQAFHSALNNRIALSLVGIGLNELSNPKNFFSKAKHLRCILSDPLWEDAYRNLNFSYFPLKWKLFFILCKYRQAKLLLILLLLISFLKSKVEK